MSTRILVADDHAIFREGLKQVIGTTVDMSVVDEAVDGKELLNKIQANDYDMVILDITMPGRNGLDVLTEMKSIKPKLPVLVMSMHPEEQYALRAYKSGAAGYLNKGSASNELLDALHKISMGKKYVSSALAESLVSGLSDHNQQDLLQSLSNREYQVMSMIASGKTVGKIATELSLSVKTVSTYRAHILRKLNMKNNAELTRFVIENKLI
ncbi:two component transcriptional regulator, LuxR family [Geobacter metallireducens RCH3]|uniref:Helix-turn-helix transcriptional response regulator, LuxR family n=1 Tax=Geobacter metallireducens (strain ATCC 53774 / DSM 7210 / GS-15) TaxID=269799 RepID=Q39TN7_GEOMG|nr:response regulator transcription factor [Geobacter metallireducens]ABB32387.1 helix-turn-helix transcriptional response regulator, LuxR family [Geobacter metallireducens GS-15]EHP86723.1 two component transcriptional regulator, LuxR family [Geobacter metallireducens RCH3]